MTWTFWNLKEYERILNIQQLLLMNSNHFTKCEEYFPTIRGIRSCDIQKKSPPQQKIEGTKCS